MDAKTGFFYFFSVVLLFAAFRVITARNPVHAVLYLILAFSQAAAVWLLLKAEFLAIALVLVYLGAVMVLFLFVVMMLDIHIDTVRKGFWKHFPLAAFLGALVAAELIAVQWAGFPAMSMSPDAPGTGVNAPDYANTKELGLLGTCILSPAASCGALRPSTKPIAKTPNNPPSLSFIYKTKPGQPDPMQGLPPCHGRAGLHRNPSVPTVLKQKLARRLLGEG